MRGAPKNRMAGRPKSVLGASTGRGTPFSAPVIARMSVPPDAARQTLINSLASSLIASGVWDTLDVLYVMAAHDAQAGRLNWISNTFNAVVNGAPAFVADQGYSTGLADYLQTGYIPATAGGKYSIGSCQFGAWSNTAASQGTSQVSIGTDFATGSSFDPCVSGKGTTLQSFVNGPNDYSTATATGQGFWELNVLGSTYTAYRNGALILTSPTIGSTTPSVSEFKIGSFNATRQWAVFSIGSALDATQSAAFYSALQTYLHAIGLV